MIDIERRLEESASEIRERTNIMTPTVIVPRRFRFRQGWVAMAAGFALVVVVVGLVPLLRGNGTTPIGDAPGTTVLLAPVTTTMSNVTTTRVEPAVASCSAISAPDRQSQAGLPDAVAVVREEIVTAARACDWERLAGYAAPGFVSSFGGGDFEDVVGDYGRLEILLRLLNTPFGVVEQPGGDRIFVWPSAFAYETWDEVPEEDVRALESIYGPGEVESKIARYESYLGWRIGITEQGDWLYFVAGD
jgi:hypothetical protein